MELLLDPRVWLAVILFSILGAVGNLVNYQIGKRGVDAVFSRFPQITPERWERVGRLYKGHGPKILFLSALPVLGFLLTTAAGAFNTKISAFLIWVITAKTIRNWLLLLLGYETVRFFSG